MQADNYFTIGTSHLKDGSPCEDYSLTEEPRPGLVLGVVSDGCSGANAHTDVGARALSFAFRKVIQDYRDLPDGWFEGAFTQRLSDQFRANSYTDTPNDQFATAVGFVTTPDNAAVYVFGDGAYALRFADGRNRLVWFEWDNNAPYYLNYKLYPSLDEEFLASLNPIRPEPLLEAWTDFRVTGKPDSPIEILAEGSRRLQFNAAEHGLVRVFRPREDGIEALAVLTDGINRIGDIPGPRAMAEFFAYKNFHGNFVKRRMLRALEQFATSGQRPQDDLAIASVWFGRKE